MKWRVGIAALLAGMIAWWVSGWPNAHPDFAVMWGATQGPHPYDQTALQRLLGWIGYQAPVVFVYPPTSLPIFTLFGLFSFRAAIALWAGLSGAALAVASRSNWTPLLLLTPPVLWALPGGQVSVILGALLFGAILLLDRPIIAGILLGTALSLKPQLAVVFPLALLLARRWTVLAVAAGVVAFMTLAAALIYGPDLWGDWLSALPDFLAKHALTAVLQRNEIASGLPVWLRAIVILGFAVVAAKALDDPPTVLVFIVAGGLIGAPHAMGYEFALLAPVYIALIARRGWAASAVVFFAMVPALIVWFPVPTPGLRLWATLLLVMTVALDWLAERPDFSGGPTSLRRRGEESDPRAVV